MAVLVVEAMAAAMVVVVAVVEAMAVATFVAVTGVQRPHPSAQPRPTPQP